MPTKPNKIDKKFSEEVFQFLKTKFKGKEVNRRTLVFYGHPFSDFDIVDLIKDKFRPREITSVKDEGYYGKDTGLSETETYLFKLYDHTAFYKENKEIMTTVVMTYVSDFDFNDGCIFVKVGELDD